MKITDPDFVPWQFVSGQVGVQRSNEGMIYLTFFDVIPEETNLTIDNITTSPTVSRVKVRLVLTPKSAEETGGLILAMAQKALGSA